MRVRECAYAWKILPCVYMSVCAHVWSRVCSPFTTDCDYTRTHTHIHTFYYHRKKWRHARIAMRQDTHARHHTHTTPEGNLVFFCSSYNSSVGLHCALINSLRARELSESLAYYNLFAWRSTVYSAPGATTACVCACVCV